MTKKSELKSTALVSDLLPEIRSLIESSRYRVAATANLELVSLYWNIGRVITQDIQKHVKRAGYGSELIEGLAENLTHQYGRGFSATNLWDTRRFFESFVIPRTLSGEWAQVRQLQMAPGVPQQSNKIPQTPSGESAARIEVDFAKHHHIGWSHYVLLMGESDPARKRFYFEQAANLRWSTRELRRQMQSALFERVALSKDARKLIALEKKNPPHEVVRYDDIFKDPYVLDFLELEGAYSEKDLEGKIIHNLQKFLSELGNDFCFITSQFRMRIDADDYFLDLLFYHRGLRCLVAIDLKIGAFTAADKGQMDLYLSWLKKHEWVADENEPVGLILCTSKKQQHVELLLAHGPHKMQVSEYLTKLPDKKVLEERLRYYSQILEAESDT
jgi:predicted nuclease of restriction endonuclease-like (RecB) superfamily